MEALVVGIYTTSAAGEPMLGHEAVELIAGGIAGDRYLTKRGHWSEPKWPDQELTLVEEELLAELGLEPGQLRRNLVTRGVLLDELIGQEFSLGESRLLGVRRCVPCKYVEQFSRKGLLKELAGRGGLRAHVIEGGILRIGDRFDVLSRPSPDPVANPTVPSN